MGLHSSHKVPMFRVGALISLLAIIAALTLLPFPAVSGMRGVAGYLPLHILLETFAIVASMLIFAVGWHAHSRNLPGSIVLLACAFFGVGLLNFAHMLSYAGMADSVTPSGTEKAVNFWLMARSLAAIALLAVALMPWRPFIAATTRYLLFAASIAATALAYWLILFHQDWLPHTFIPGQGLTAFKIASGYAIIALNLSAAVVLGLRMRKPLPFDAAGLFGALCVMALSEFFFTLYANVTDVFNLMGHIYKVIAYLLLCRTIFIEAIENPYHQLNASQSQLQATINAIPDTLLELGLDGRYHDFYSTHGDLPATSTENLLEKTVAEVLPPAAADVVMAALREAQESGLSYGKVMELSLVRGKCWLEFSVSSKAVGAGQAPRFIVLSRDITATKSAQLEIERLSRAYCLLSRVNEAIVRSHDRNQLFATICAAAVESKLFCFAWIGMLDGGRVMPVAHADAEADYLSGRFFISLDDEHTKNELISKAINENIHVICQDIEHDSGVMPWRDNAIKRGFRACAAFPVCEAGVVTGAMNIFAAETQFFTPDIVELMRQLAADISFSLDTFAGAERRKLAEAGLKRLNLDLEQRVLERTRQLEMANKELEAFSYSVSHDLRAPLRSIDGFSQVVLKTCHEQLDATAKDYLQRVRRASQRMGNMIDDLLQLSQVARSLLKREPIDLSKIVKQTAEDLSRANPERQVQFILQPGLSVQADAGLLRIVMNNLLGNAWKYTGKKATAKIEFGQCDIDGQDTFFVRDNGGGFNMDYSHKLFDTFQRLHGENEFEGTGIGLTTVQRVIHRHNGKVWAEGKEGQGATFYFTLPQRQREMSA